MGSREVNTYGISSEQIAENLKNAKVIDGFDNIADYIVENMGEKDLVITMGGGDIYKAAHKIIEKYK
jgi:UDP-N-acetylmuramate--alanine ligase